MGKKFWSFLGLAVLASGLIWLGNFYWKNLRGIGPAVKRPPRDIASPAFNTTGLPLHLPPGFSISIFAEDLPGARVMSFDLSGNIWVSQTSEGQVSLIEIKDGKGVGQKTVLKNLRKPHGLALWCLPERETNPDACQLYIAEEDKISRAQISYRTPPRFDIGEGERVRLGALQKITDLPSGGGHFTRTIKFGPDGRLYVSIGSSCNVCHEKDVRRAAIYSMNKDGSDVRPYATGLRNAVFFDWSYVDGRMWATEMGRDFLGDDLPPDEINILAGPSTSPRRVKNYGWPYYYGKNIRDETFESNVLMKLADLTPSYIDIPAHSAPLGLAFVPESTVWPEEYWHDLLVAYHGSWNRSKPTGYKIVRIKLDEQGNDQGTDSTRSRSSRPADSPPAEDFITGWLTPEGALGRPVDLMFGPDKSLYISDDKAGVIYRVSYSE